MQPVDRCRYEAALAFACEISFRAAERVKELRSRGHWSGTTLAELGDHAADGYLVGRITGSYPEDGLLSEETRDSEVRLKKRRVWIIDPVDGSKEFGLGTNEWAVQTALAEHGELRVGALALGDGTLIAGIITPHFAHAIVRGGGSLSPGKSPSPERLRVVMSKNHTPPWTGRFLELLGADISLFSGVGFKTARCLLGEADCYVHDGRTSLNEWDTAAPEAVARALGWSVTDLSGAPLVYNRRAPQTGSFVLCRPADRIRVLAALGAVKTM